MGSSYECRRFYMPGSEVEASLTFVERHQSKVIPPVAYHLRVWLNEPQVDGDAKTVIDIMTTKPHAMNIIDEFIEIDEDLILHNDKDSSFELELGGGG